MVGLIKIGVLGNDMEDKNTEESERPKCVKLRAMKAVTLWFLWVRGYGRWREGVLVSTGG